MMRNRRLGSNLGLISALAVAGLFLAWLCVCTTAINMLPHSKTLVQKIAPGNAEMVLNDAASALVKQRGILDPATLAAVRSAALDAPLDARAFLILGHQQLLDNQPDRAVKTLEAGQRLDPRERLIHLLLLDRYLRSERYADAAAQFSVLARLVGPTKAPIAQAMAAMILSPEASAAARKTLRADLGLEIAVLTALAKSDTAPDAIFAVASPAARAHVADERGWGRALVARLVSQQRYATARQMWQRIYGLSDAQASAPVFNASFNAPPAAPPFDWTLTTGSLGAAEIRDGGLLVDYYGRDSGPLAQQMLVLRPGRYRFAVTVESGATDTASKLFWTLSCSNNAKVVPLNVQVSAGPKRRQIAAEMVVPVQCPAQLLTLRAEAGEFPATISLILRDLTVGPAPEARP